MIRILTVSMKRICDFHLHNGCYKENSIIPIGKRSRLIVRNQAVF